MDKKNEKGSIAVFVLVGLVFMASFLLIALGSNVNKSKIAKEQFNIISEIYSYGDGNDVAYNRAYTALRKKNKGILTEEVEKCSTIVLTKTFAQELYNIRIYGSTDGYIPTLGEYNSSSGKYEIEIKVTGENGNKKTYTISLPYKLNTNEYIDYGKNAVVVMSSGIREVLEMPTIYAYEDYTKIEVIRGGTPSKIEVDYVGYSIE